MDAILFSFGDYPVSLLQVGAAVSALVVALLLFLSVVLFRQSRERELEAQAQLERQARSEEQVAALLRSQMELFGRLQGVGEVLSNKQSELAKAVSERLD